MQSSHRQPRKLYSFAFKKKAVELVKNAESIANVARQLKVPHANIHYWLKAEEEGRLVEVKKTKRQKPGKSGTRRRYPLEFRLAAVRRAKKMGSITAAARELGVPDQTLHHWVENDRKGALGAYLNFSAEEIRALKLACDAQLRMLKFSHPAQGKETVKHLASAQRKLKRVRA